MRDPLKTRGHWRASLRDADGWQEWRPAAGRYLSADLVEWGSITKGVVGTTASMLLDSDRSLAWYAPEFRDATYTIGDLIHHTSGLPRLPRSLRPKPLGDPYRATVGRPVDPADARPASAPGEFCYSNLGYALLGAALDHTCGSWLAAVQECVLDPAGITTATVDPPPDRQTVPTLWFGRPVEPWHLGGSPYAAAGGLWSTFDDLCRYAEWALGGTPEGNRTVSWQRDGGSVWINGEVRASGAVVAAAEGVTVVVHSLAQTPHAADRIGAALIRRALRYP